MSKRGDDLVIVSVKELEGLILKVLRQKYDLKDSKKIKDVLMFGQLSGMTSHGVVRLATGATSVLAQEPTDKVKIIEKTKVSAVVEGNKNSAMLVAPIAMENAIKKAQKNGFAIVGTRGTNSTSGSLTYYAEKIAKENLIGIVMARASSTVAPFGSFEKLLGTNPVAFGVPKKGGSPWIFDMATAATTRGATLKSLTLGKKLSEGVAVDKNGDITTDPQEALDGAFLPFGNSYKGSGLAMMVEIFAGILPGAGFADRNSDRGWGNLFIVFSPELLSDLEGFKSNVADFVEGVKNAKTKSGKQLRISGEQELRLKNERIKNDQVPIAKKLFEELKHIKC